MNAGLSKIRSVHTYELKGFILVMSTVKRHRQTFDLCQKLGIFGTFQWLLKRTLDNNVSKEPFFLRMWPLLEWFRVRIM